jgi:hypothetical protein
MTQIESLPLTRYFSSSLPRLFFSRIQIFNSQLNFSDATIYQYFFFCFVLSLLPAPRNQLLPEHPAADAPLYPNRQKIQETNKRIPPYGQRQGWVPRTPEDFGDGGKLIFISYFPYLKNTKIICTFR